MPILPFLYLLTHTRMYLFVNSITAFASWEHWKPDYYHNLGCQFQTKIRLDWSPFLLSYFFVMSKKTSISSFYVYRWKNWKQEGKKKKGIFTHVFHFVEEIHIYLYTCIYIWHQDFNLTSRPALINGVPPWWTIKTIHVIIVLCMCQSLSLF